MAHPLSYTSIRLLLNHSAVEWVGVATTPGSVREPIASSRPDTIVIEGREGTVTTDALDMLQAGSWQVRVIGFNPANHKISVYQH